MYRAYAPIAVAKWRGVRRAETRGFVLGADCSPDPLLHLRPKWFYRTREDCAEGVHRWPNFGGKAHRAEP